MHSFPSVVLFASDNIQIQLQCRMTTIACVLIGTTQDLKPQPTMHTMSHNNETPSKAYVCPQLTATWPTYKTRIKRYVSINPFFSWGGKQYNVL